MELTVSGIINCPNPTLTRNGVFIDYETASRYLEMEGEATQLVFRLPEGKQGEKIFTELKENSAGIDPDLTVMNWEELAYDFIALTKAKSMGSSVVLILVFIIAAVGISNTMLMSIYERKRELGMMRALGMMNREIRNMFFLEAAGIGFLGSVSGAVLGILLNIPMVINGIDYSAWTRKGDMGYRILSVFYGDWRPGSIILAVLFCIVLSGLIAFFSTRKIMKKGITDCLREG